jgi:hypothetical protein
MEWLNYLAARPDMLNSLTQWLKEQEQSCINHVLDASLEEFPILKAKRAAFQDIRAFIHNNTPIKGHSNGVLVTT